MLLLTAFVREVVLPGGREAAPRLDPKRCCFKFAYGPSSIHRWGIFAAEPISARRRVIEYTGQLIDEREAERRSLRQHLYLFTLDQRWKIDGAIGGSGAEFINHSCEPNLYVRRTRTRIFLHSRRMIAAGEELTLDYKVDGADEILPCGCGSESCRGYLNAAIPPERSETRIN